MAFENYKETHSAPASDVVDVSGGDQKLKQTCRGIYVGAAGNLVCRLEKDTSDRTFTGLLAGQVYPLAISIIRAAASGTTITSSVVLY